MAEIPSDIASSAAQAGFQAKEVAKEREARRSGKADAVRRQAQAVDEAGSTVDTEDGDTAVFSDAEGSGSLGRPFDENEDEEPQHEGPSHVEGVSEDDEGHLHVDLEA